MPQKKFVGERLDLLMKWVPAYRSHQSARTVSQFWPLVMTEYLQKFPEDNVPTPPVAIPPVKTPCGRKSKQRPEGVPKPIRDSIKEWYQNLRRHPTLSADDSEPKGHGLFTNFLVKPDKKLQEWQVFSMLYFPTKVKPFLDYEGYCASLPPGEKPIARLAYSNRETRAIWDIRKRGLYYI
ncbi:hypothetical protein DENSPDRAFT_887135 [Dentipellis sp. KUC8613]|nr:hypothetical protein DENSPDRAFT_887135 [Dentipellis sp. KUC8613]